ncbi:MAG: hypothetical protein B6U68_02175 [Candidatus Aenigmarchaeota archaeon ex4484_14]|nr:MAG: hypothetical protein B6U68_02175 [Candidatus Aenigmarchaeota archaeon ex4484_14]
MANQLEKMEKLEQKIEKPDEDKLVKEKEKKEEDIKKKLEKLRKRQLKLADKFKDEVVKKFGKVVKSIVIFGSFIRGDFHEKSDIDLLVIIDDTAARFTEEMKTAFDEKIQAIGKGISKDISVQPSWTLTEFWEMARIGHPLLYTIVRDGWALYDTGFFIPTRKLLEMGKIPGTLEAIELFMEGAPKKIQRAEMAKLYMIAEDLYYAMLNSSQAVLMYMGLEAPAPKYVVRDVEQHLIRNKLLKKKYLKYLKNVIDFRKNVEHKKIKNVSGEKLDKFIENAKEYVGQMSSILNAFRKKKKNGIIVKNYEVMIKAAVAVLKRMDKLPPDPKDLPAAIDKYLINAGLVSASYKETFKRVVTMRKMAADGEGEKIPERDVELTREYVRRFVRDISKIIEGIEAKEKTKVRKETKSRKKAKPARKKARKPKKAKK